MLFQSDIPFQEPPRKFRGMLILESDDGRRGSYTHWRPLLKSKRQNTQWYPFDYPVVACEAVNANTIGNSDRMTRAELDELVAEGWEIMNHGASHAGLAAYRLRGEGAKVGDTTITVNLIGMNSSNEYVIKDEATGVSEIIKPTTDEIATVTLDKPLNNNYPYSSLITLTPESLEREINGGLDTLRSWGYDVKHHVAPYHYWYYTSKVKLRERHKTSRTSNDSQTNTFPINDLYALSGVLDGYFTNDSDVQSFIDKISSEDSIGIWYGHAAEYTKGSILDKLVDYANEKGVKIVTRDEAYTKKLQPLL